MVGVFGEEYPNSGAMFWVLMGGIYGGGVDDAVMGFKTFSVRLIRAFRDKF